MRKAINVAKAFPQVMSTAPTQVGGRDATNVNDGEKAYKQLMALAQEQRRRSPTLTIEQSFARVYAAPENAALANRGAGRTTTRASRFNRSACEGISMSNPCRTSRQVSVNNTDSGRGKSPLGSRART